MQPQADVGYRVPLNGVPLLYVPGLPGRRHVQSSPYRVESDIDKSLLTDLVVCSLHERLACAQVPDTLQD